MMLNSWLIFLAVLLLLVELVDLADHYYPTFRFIRRVSAARSIIEHEIGAPVRTRDSNFSYGTAQYEIGADALDVAQRVADIRGALARPVLLTWDRQRTAYLTVFLYGEGF